MNSLPEKLSVAVLFLASGMCVARAGQPGQMTHDHVLLGMHFLHTQSDNNATGEGVANVTPGFWDYVTYMPEDLAHVSYADFWHWWSEFERYKGDERGLAEMDSIIQACLQRGMKVKIDLAWSTWWTNDKDWNKDANLIIGPVDLDDWVHLCDLLGRRYRGRVALWMLQGEANNLEQYWQGAPIEHVHEVYRRGYRAFKRVDPGVMISIAGASPSQSREALDDWVKSHATACRGMYDDIPMNYFADVVGGDPYHSLLNYYRSIRKTLDDLAEHDVEIGSGESSFQWALDSYQVTSTPGPWKTDFDPNVQQQLSEEGQAWRCNESLGTFFDVGGNKFMFWGTEFAPGAGWPWRWGIRKYQDWWGIWPETHKILGTNIVFRYDNPDGRKVDLRPGWTSAQTDPYHPMWEVYKFWAQACPPASEAIRLPASVSGSGPRILRLATYLRSRDTCVALVQNDKPTPIALEIDLDETGWSSGTALEVRFRNESIDYTNGARTVNREETFSPTVAGGKIRLDLPDMAGFSTIAIARHDPSLAAECRRRIIPHRVEVGKPTKCLIELRNIGKETWLTEAVTLALYPSAAKGLSWKLPVDVAPGDSVTVPIQLPAAETPGHTTHFFGLRGAGSDWFGPIFSVSAAAEELDAPRKLLAFREVEHVRLKWFAPERAPSVEEYEIQRADGFEKPFRMLKRITTTEYVDRELEMDRAYYYRVVAIRGSEASRPSNEDNAKALSTPRIYDAEIVSHTVPEQVRRNDPHTATITIRNTGSRAWDLKRPHEELRFFLNATQQWGSQEEGQLPRIDLAGTDVVAPGESITLKIPYSGSRPGRWENHWVLCMDVGGKGRIYFGTPLLAETVVTPE